ncbi:acyl-CoA dehydrogenase family protein [Nocardia blacklockiae]|uniref:acyl-CoA dehydrogenase family protein n=1 Tax=Nocardia blacklockiae TaxID=480036 RepID=UPI0018944D0B|nr:acyl-CoA dehydrogenase family protein [Nocardia blacklockiae]MBF6170138.1 acyl-CoA dehydrogenase [Nocardia blacklockiae]
MRIELSSEATEFGRQVVRALGAAGGDELVRAGEIAPQRRESLIAPVLGALGAWELEPRRDPEELEAAAALCRGAGYWATPYPVAERLARPVDLDVDGLLVVAGTEPVAAVAHLDLRWAAVTLDGVCGAAVTRPPVGAARETAFVAPLDMERLDGHTDPALPLVLSCWTLLGMLDRAVELAREHVLVREQFGRPLAEFQSVQFQLTDAEVERRGADLLARYALWSVQQERDDALVDALTLRSAMLTAADTVFRVAHQLHGALGFCDESPLSWLSRHSLPLRWLPVGAAGTDELLTRLAGRAGPAGLFEGEVYGR